MQNMEVIIYPKQIHISTLPTISLRLTYKKVAISTNHELQKYQNRESYPIRNCVSIINDQVKFKLSKQFELNNTKIVIIVIGIKGRDIICLGDISLDLPTLRERSMKSLDSFKAKIDKCKDPKAYLEFQIKFIQKTVDLNQLKKSRKEKEKQVQKIPQLGTQNQLSSGILKTDYYYKQQLYISRRQKQDKPTAYEISRKNYVPNLSKQKKNNEITRNNNITTITKTTVSKQKRLSTDSLKQNSNNGSYKKRFMYDVKRTQKTSRDRSHTKQLGSNYLKVYQKDKSPSPRMKTPQPITLQALKQKNQRIKSKIQPLNLSAVENYKIQTDFIDPDTFRAHPIQAEHYHKTTSQQQDISHSNISVSSISSINNEKDSKYKMITDKLQMIESKIKSQKEKYIENHDQQQEKDKKISRSQIQEIDHYAIGQNDKQKYSPNTERVPFNKQKPISPFQDTQVNYHKKQYSPNSPSQSTCPRNQRAPSPINLAAETPQAIKKQPQSVKMSEFTINSRKNQIYQLQQQKSPQNQSISQSQATNARTFDNIISPSIKTEEYKQSSIGPSPRVGSKEKREISPTGLSFERRQSQLKLQKKSSLGRNYIQTQVKMMQLQIQQKDMKYERLQKKYAKKQQECNKLITQNEQFQKKVMQVSHQLIQAKSRVLQLQRQSQQMEMLAEKLKQKQSQVVKHKQQIGKLKEEIKNLNLLPKLSIPETPQQSIPQLPKILQSLVDKNIQTQQEEKPQSDFVDNKIQIEFTDETQLFKKIIQQKQDIIQSLNSQLQTYLNQIDCLRKRNEEILPIKQQYNELKQKYQENLKIQQQKLKQSPINKLQTNSFNSPVSQSPQNSSKHILSPQSSKSAKQLLQQTIQKQTLLQQSLKSLQNQNKSLAESVKTLQQEKNNLLQKIHISEDQKIKLQAQIDSLQIKLQSNRGKQTQFQLKLRQIENERNLLNEKLSRKQKTIQKLSGINQSLNSKIFNLQQENNNKFNELNQQTDMLVLKNAENEHLINELNQKLNSKQKQMSILKQLLRDREDEEIKQKQQRNKKVMKRDPSSDSQKQVTKNVRFSDKFRASKSDQFIKVKTIEEDKSNFYESYLNEKAKSTNLEAQLRYAENDMRNLKMKIDLLTHEKKDLEQEIDMIAYNNDKELAKKGLEHKVSMDSNSISETAKLQNRALKQEIKLLQTQVQDLNILLDSAIQRTANFQASQIASLLSNPQVQRNIMNEKYVAMSRRLQAYEQQLRTKKNKMAEIINAIWRGGNATLIDQIDRIMGSQE